MSREGEINTLLEQNIAKVMRDGPRARYDYNIWVEARDRADGWVLFGGLGAMGCGQMWEPDGPDQVKYPGYDDAPERSSIGGFGRDN